MPMTQSLAVSALVVLCSLWLVATSTIYAICPDSSFIKPCTCDDEGLQCVKLNDSGLLRLFSAPAERKAIRKVWIFQTNLTRLHKKAFGDYIIKDLYLDLNQIARVEPGAFGEAAKTLQSLSLTRNSIDRFPFDELQQMRKLKQLGLGYNQLAKLDQKFAASDSLESLDLSHNNIRDIAPNVFAELYELAVMDLSKNELEVLRANSLQVKSAQKQLVISLRANKIHTVAPDAFGKHHPHSVDLSRNRLTHLPEMPFRALLSNSTHLEVDDNPFSCYGCKQYKWLLELDKEDLANLESFVCLDGTKLESLTPERIGCSQSDLISAVPSNNKVKVRANG